MRRRNRTQMCSFLRSHLDGAYCRGETPQVQIRHHGAKPPVRQPGRPNRHRHDVSNESVEVAEDPESSPPRLETEIVVLADLAVGRVHWRSMGLEPNGSLDSLEDAAPDQHDAGTGGIHG